MNYIKFIHTFQLLSLKNLIGFGPDTASLLREIFKINTFSVKVAPGIVQFKIDSNNLKEDFAIRLFYFKFSGFRDSNSAVINKPSFLIRTSSKYISPPPYCGV